jgi:hypothetical protein
MLSLTAAVLLAAHAAGMGGDSSTGFIWKAPAAYQNEAEATVSWNGDTVVGLEYTYHFNPIPDRGKPYGLGSFFFSKNSVTVGVSDTDETDDNWNIAGVYLIPETKCQLVAEVGGEVSPAWWGSRADETAFMFGAQYAVLRNFKVRSRYTIEDNMEQIDLGAIYVHQFGTQAVSPFAEVVMDNSHSDREVGINMGVDYYPLKELSIGLVVADMTEDLNPWVGTIYVFNARYYTGPLAITATYTELDDPLDDVFSLGVEVRF